MSSSMRWRKGVMGRWIFMTRLLALREMTSWAWRCGHAIDVGVIVRWTGWDDEPDAGHQGRDGRGFVQRVGELFSSREIMQSFALFLLWHIHDYVTQETKRSSSPLKYNDLLMA